MKKRSHLKNSRFDVRVNQILSNFSSKHFVINLFPLLLLVGVVVFSVHIGLHAQKNEPFSTNRIKPRMEKEIDR